MWRAWILGLIISGGIYYYGMHTNFVNYAASYVVYPVLYLHHTLIDPIKKWRHEKQELAAVKQDLERITKEYERVLSENIYLYAAVSYMNGTKELRDFKSRYEDPNATIVRVIARTFSDQAHFFLIDAGFDKGIQKDMVVVYKNNLVGRVSDVYPWYSKVCLITDRQCKVAAHCTESNVQGIHEGRNSQDVTDLAHVSHLAQVKENEIVLSSGDGMVFPEGFALGTVCQSTIEGLYNRITISPLCDFKTIDYCMVISRR